MFAARDDCERLQVIVDELLNLSRIESGQIDLHRRRVDPETLVGAALDVHRAAAEQARIALVAEVPPGLPDVFVDPDRLAARLLEPPRQRAPLRARGEPRRRARARRASGRRACAATRRGGRRTSASRCRTRAPASRRRTRQGLFEKFFRVPGSPAGGSGLGLFIAKGLVQAHGGDDRRREHAGPGRDVLVHRADGAGDLNSGDASDAGA